MGDVVAVEPHRPGRGPEQAAAGIEGRRLAGAVGPDQAGDPPERRLERDVRDGLVAAVVNADVDDFETHRAIPAGTRVPVAARGATIPGEGAHGRARRDDRLNVVIIWAITSRLAMTMVAATAITPKANICRLVSKDVRYPGTTDSRAAARIELRSNRVPHMARTAMYSSDETGPYGAVEAVPYWDTAKAPAIPAKKAETQKTMSRVTFTPRPWVASIVGVSDMARRSRPSRLVAMATITTMQATAMARTRK